MSETPPRTIRSAPAVSPSMIPSDVPEGALPFGPAPAALVQQENESGGIDDDLRHAVRALAANANDIRHVSPIKAAVCWHEAGRLLQIRAGRPAEAWTCHSRAIAIHPDHRPSLKSLRRLARQAGAKDSLVQLLEAHADRATCPAEAAAISTELGTLALERGDRGGALDALREASRAFPETLVSHLLRLGVAVGEKDDEDVADTLELIADKWPEPSHASELTLTLALIEEQLGRVDAASARLNAAAAEETLTVSGLWVRLRLALRIGHFADALDALANLYAAVDDPTLRGALKRIEAAIDTLTADQSFEPDSAAASRSYDEDQQVWDLKLLQASSTGDDKTAVLAAERLRSQVGSASFGAALALSKTLGQWAPGDGEARLPDSVDPMTPAARAIADYLGIGTAVEQSAAPEARTERPIDDLFFSALTSSDWEGVVSVLSTLRERTSDERDRWSLAVAESSVLMQHLDRPEDALSMLRGESDRLNRPPLPALIRSYDPRPESLAELAVAEAEDGDNDEFKAWRYGWAGHHLENVDPHESGRLYIRSLELKPTLPMSLAGLGRSVTDRRVLAESCLNAAEITTEPKERLRFLIQAGGHYLAQGDGMKATELFSDALELSPDDKQLRSSVIRLALNNFAAASPEIVHPPASVDGEEPEEPTRQELNEIIAHGSLALEMDPHEAMGWFEKAIENDPNDPIVLSGLRQARVLAGHASTIEAELTSRLEQAESEIERARLNLELAHLQRWQEGDAIAAASHLAAFDEAIPGHRPAVVRLLTQALGAEESGSRKKLLASLKACIEDETDATALARELLLYAPNDTDQLRELVDRDPTSNVESALLAAMTDDGEERLRLLERLIVSMDDSATHLSLLAAERAKAGDHSQAVALTSQALDYCPGGSWDLHALTRYARAAGNHQLLMETLIEIANATPIQELRIDGLLEAALIARDDVGDTHRASDLCLEVLALDPENDRAFTLSRGILDSGDDPEGKETDAPRQKDGEKEKLVKLYETRIKGVHNVQEKRKIHLEIAALLGESDDPEERDRAKEHLTAALEIVQDDLANHRLIAMIHRRDEEWNDAIAHLLEAARLAKDPGPGIEVFFALGELYMDHTDKEDLAEKSFLKVLGWDRSHLPSMIRIADLYLRTGNEGRAAQALDHVIKLADDPKLKVEKCVALARLLDEKMGRTKDAEKILGEARNLDPYAIEPVEMLTEIYQRQGDNMALNIHLDGALANQATVLRDEPDRIEVYDSIRKILLLKRDTNLAGMAAEAMGILGTPVPGTPGATRWEVGSRPGDPTYDEYLCSKLIPAGLRETMRAVEETLSRLEGLTPKQMGLDRGKRLGRKHRITTLVGELYSGYGVDAPQAFSDTQPGLRIVPGSPAALIFPSSLAEIQDEEVLRFAVSYALAMLRHGFGLSTLLPAERLRTMLAAALSLVVSNLKPRGVDPAAMKKEAARIAAELPPRVLDQIRPFAFDCTDALDRQDLVVDMAAIGARTGLIGAGSLTASIRGLRSISEGAAKSSSLSALPGAGRLMYFVFSRDHIELRVRMGI